MDLDKWYTGGERWYPSDIGNAVAGEAELLAALVNQLRRVKSGMVEVSGPQLRDLLDRIEAARGEVYRGLDALGEQLREESQVDVSVYYEW